MAGAPDTVCDSPGAGCIFLGCIHSTGELGEGVDGFGRLTCLCRCLVSFFGASA